MPAHFGKWHLGSEPYSPLQQGFDVDIPHWPGPGQPWHFYFGPATTHRTWIKGSGKKLWGIEPEYHKEYLPLQHGFQEYFGIPYSNDMKPCIYVRGNEEFTHYRR